MSRSRDSVMARFAVSGGTTPYSPQHRRKRRRPCRYISTSDSDDQNHSITYKSSSDTLSSDDGTPRTIPITRSFFPEQPGQETQEESEEPEIENSTQSECGVVLSDTDVLDCPICLDPLSPPVFQCVSGHLVCSSCSNKLNNKFPNPTKCPSCSRPISLNRCIAVEKILESAKTWCRNRQNGCFVIISYGEKLEHEKSCKFTACSCPHDGCNYVALSNRLYWHFSIQHSSSVHRYFHVNVNTRISLPKDINRVFLQERRGSRLFVLSRTIVPPGSLFSVVCVAPTSSGAKYAYSLAIRAGHMKRCQKTCVEVAPNCDTQPPRKNCILITSDFADRLEGLELQLLIQAM